MLRVLFWVTLWLCFIEKNCDLEIFRENRQLLEQGEEQIKSAQRLVLSPYGECWIKALSNLKSSCPRLIEDSHSKLAFQFANCFMQQTGFPPIDCDEEMTSCLQKVKSEMHWFTAYLQYHTHTHNMCYFLNHQLWLQKTERTIKKLSDMSQEFSQMLEDSTSKQIELINIQSESVNVQKTLLQQGESLNSYLEISHSRMTKNFDEFQKTTRGQQTLVMDMLNKLSFWMQFLVDHISSFYTMTFYLVIAFSSFILTSTPRTSRARACLIFLWMLVYVLELKFRFEQESLWRLRYGGLAASLGMLIYCGVSYQDYESINNRILRDVHKAVTSAILPGPQPNGALVPSPVDTGRNLVQLFSADARSAILTALDQSSSESDSWDETFVPSSSSDSERSSSFSSLPSSSRTSTPVSRPSSRSSTGPTILALEDGSSFHAKSSPSLSSSNRIQHSYNLRQRRSLSGNNHLTTSVELLQLESPRRFARFAKVQSKISKINSAIQTRLIKNSLNQFSDGE